MTVGYKVMRVNLMHDMKFCAMSDEANDRKNKYQLHMLRAWKAYFFLSVRFLLTSLYCVVK